MTKAQVLLINPPLWNAYAPHLAIPLLTSVLRNNHVPVRALDLSIETLDWLISKDGLKSLREKILHKELSSDDNILKRANIVYDATMENIDKAKEVLRSIDSLYNHTRFLESRIVLRNALWCISSAFPKLNFDLVANNLYYSARSTKSVMDAAVDPQKNVYRWAFEKLLDKYILNEDLSLIGISVSADTQLVSAITAAMIIREKRPDIHITMGGNFLTRIVTRWSKPHRFFDFIDSFILYEGENALQLLCEKILEGNTTDVPGMVIRDKDRLVFTPPQAVNLDANIVPDFDDLPLNKYFAPGPVIPTYASRGCAWDCSFCSIPFASNRFRIRNSKKIVDDLEFLKDRYKTKYFMFIDEIMPINMLHSISEELIKRNSKIFWYCETRFDKRWTRGLARSLYLSGCRRINFGLESYNQRVLDLMNKMTDISSITSTVEACLSEGVPIHLFIIFGFPGESVEEIMNTISFAEKTMKKSATRCNIPYSTWGVSPFELDLHSPIGMDPNSYGIEIIPSTNEDLTLLADYRVKNGVGQAEANQLVLSTSNHVDVPLKLKEFTWFHHSSSKDIEEEIFLRACHNTGFPTDLKRSILRWSDDFENSLTWLSHDVTIYGYKEPEKSHGSNIILYKLSRDYILEFPTRYRNWINELKHPMDYDGRIKSAIEQGLSEDDSVNLLKLLIRFEFLNTSNETGTKINWSSDKFYQESNTCAEFNENTGYAIVSNSTTGRSMKLNAKAYGIWLLCREGIKLHDTMSRSLGISKSEMTATKDLLEKLVEFGFLYAEH